MSDYFEEIRANATYTNMSSGQNPVKPEGIHSFTLIVHTSLHGKETRFINIGSVNSKKTKPIIEREMAICFV